MASVAHPSRIVKVEIFGLPVDFVPVMMGNLRRIITEAAVRMSGLSFFDGCLPLGTYPDFFVVPVSVLDADVLRASALVLHLYFLAAGSQTFTLPHGCSAR
jgi:hypothetical protein